MERLLETIPTVCSFVQLPMLSLILLQTIDNIQHALGLPLQLKNKEMLPGTVVLKRNRFVTHWYVATVYGCVEEGYSSSEDFMFLLHG